MRDEAILLKKSSPPRLVWLLALGLVLRLYHYGRNPAVWHDEAAIVINIIRKNFLELLGPLYASATGPPIFLWLQKSVTLLFGDSTYALRLVSVLASCAGLVVFLRLAPRTLAPLGAFCAVLLVACSDRLLWHAAEARHYSTDFLVAAILLTLLHRTATWPTPRRIQLFALLSPVVIFSSYPGVFLCGGIFVALLPAMLREKRWAAGVLFSLTIGLAFIAFAFLTIRFQRSAAMDAAWVQTFPDWQRPWSVPYWAARSTVSVFDYICRPIGGILLAAAVMGGFRFWRGGRRELVLFALTPMLLAMIAAFGKAYPYTGARTMVFAMPALALMIGGGIDAISAWRPQVPTLQRSALTLLILPLAATFLFAFYRVVLPWPRAGTAAASAYVLAHRQNNEPVTANHWEYEYYFRRLGSGFVPEMHLLEEQNHPRIWIVVTAHDTAIRDRLINSLDKWQIIERREFERTSVLLATPRL